MQITSFNLDDHVDDLDTWITTLEDLGINTRTVLADEAALEDKLADLSHYRRLFEQSLEQGDIARRTANRLASTDSLDYETAAAIIREAAGARDPAYLERVAEIFDRTQERLATQRVKRFAARGAGVHEILRPAFDRIVSEVSRLWATIPSGVTTLETAARFGLTRTWEELEDLARQWKNLETVHEGWFKAGIIPIDRGAAPAGRYLSGMFLFRDYTLRSLLRTQVGTRTTARLLTGADPALLTVAQVDALGSTNVEPPSDRDREAEYRRDRDQQESALKELQRTKPKQLQLSSSGRALVE